MTVTMHDETTTRSVQIRVYYNHSVHAEDYINSVWDVDKRLGWDGMGNRFKGLAGYRRGILWLRGGCLLLTIFTVLFHLIPLAHCCYLVRRFSAFLSELKSATSRSVSSFLSSRLIICALHLPKWGGGGVYTVSKLGGILKNHLPSAKMLLHRR